MDQMQGRAEAGAKRGYLTASIDCRYHGRRCPPGEDKRDCYEHALVRSALCSHPRVSPQPALLAGGLICSLFLLPGVQPTHQNGRLLVSTLATRGACIVIDCTGCKAARVYQLIT